jgi:hypothetical protein
MKVHWGTLVVGFVLGLLLSGTVMGAFGRRTRNA